MIAQSFELNCESCDKLIAYSENCKSPYTQVNRAVWVQGQEIRGFVCQIFTKQTNFQQDENEIFF